MIKRVIFDIDNTLIPWKKEYDDEIYKALKEMKIEYTEEEVKKLSEAFTEYENVYYTFNKEKMIKFINEYTGKNYPKEYIDVIINRWAKCTPDKLPDSTLKTLEYLKNKYELVVLTDWFKEQQIERLKNSKIIEYFQEVYAAEKTKRKPFKEAFIQAIGENKPEECIMIGDDFQRDIEGALKAGLQAIYYNPNDIDKIEKISYYKFNNDVEEKEVKYYTISKLDEIIDIF
ncbi:MAG: HAD family hydrolase [Clostridia bacterium]